MKRDDRNTEPLRLIRPEWRFFALGSLGSVIVAATAPLLPLLVVRPLFDEVLGKGNFAQLPNLIALSLAILLTSSLALYAQDALYGLGAAHFAARVRTGLYDTALDAEVTSKDTSSGVAARTALDVRELELFYSGDLTSIVGQGLSIVTVSAALLIASPTMTLLLVAVFAPLVLISSAINARLEQSLSNAQRLAQTAAAWFAQTLEKRELLKSFRAEPRFKTVFADINQAARRASSRRSGLVALSAPLAQLTAGLGAIALLGFASLEVQNGRLTIAGLTSYVSLLALALGPAQIFARGYARQSAIRAPAKSIAALLEVSMPLETGTLTTRPTGDLALEGVSLIYPDALAPALHNVSFNLTRGQTLAIIGSSGSGKTTLTRLLLRLLEPDAGRITLGGVNSRDYTRAAWRSSFAFVPQAAQLLPGSVRENLTLFGQSSDDALWSALERVGLKAEIAALPDQLEFRLGENGAGLSGGQGQRLAIARALLLDADILILDEPTASLDSASEGIVRDTLLALGGTKTVIVIAHRLTTIQHADFIAVFENGALLEFGSPIELRAQSGRYAELLALSISGSSRHE